MIIQIIRLCLINNFIKLHEIKLTTVYFTSLKYIIHLYLDTLFMFWLRIKEFYMLLIVFYTFN